MSDIEFNNKFNKIIKDLEKIAHYNCDHLECCNCALLIGKCEKYHNNDECRFTCNTTCISNLANQILTFYKTEMRKYEQQ